MSGIDWLADGFCNEGQLFAEVPQADDLIVATKAKIVCQLQRALFRLSVVLAFLLSTSANAQLTFTADPINGKVVDEESGLPLTGVIIVAMWIVDETYVGRSNDVLNVLETVTDEDGNYHFPSWGDRIYRIVSYFK